MKNSDTISIFESYRQGKTVHYYLTEQEKQEEQVKQKLRSALESPEAQEAIVNNAKNLFDKYKKEINTAKSSPNAREAIESLLKRIEAEQKQQVQKESLELQEEGWWDRLVSRGSGALRQGQELMKGGSTPTKGYDTHKVLKRFEILQKSIGKDLRELERDLGTSSNKDDTVKQQVAQMIQVLDTKHNIKPVQSKLGDIRHKAGVLGQNIATGAILGAGVLAIAAPVITALGITGPAAAAVGAGVSAASTSALRDLIYGEKPNTKKAIISGVLAATAAGFIRHYLDSASNTGVGKAAPTTTQTGTEPSVTSAPPVAPKVAPITPRIDPLKLFQQATESPYTGAKIDIPRMQVLKTLIDANTENNLGLSQGQIAKIFGDWSARSNIGAGTSNANKIINAIKDASSQQDLVRLMTSAAKKIRK